MLVIVKIATRTEFKFDHYFQTAICTQRSMLEKKEKQTGVMTKNCSANVNSSMQVSDFFIPLWHESTSQNIVRFSSAASFGLMR